jgi:ketosteroid isomerase-like protein
MDWSAAFFADVDKKDINALAAWFGEDITARFGSNPPIAGRAAVTEAFRGFYDSIAGMRHSRDQVFVDGNSICSAATVTYTRHDGSEVSMPAATILHREPSGKLDRLFIYIDINPLYAPAA